VSLPLRRASISGLVYITLNRPSERAALRSFVSLYTQDGEVRGNHDIRVHPLTHPARVRGHLSAAMKVS
jgi:hypothetical protein